MYTIGDTHTRTHARTHAHARAHTHIHTQTQTQTQTQTDRKTDKQTHYKVAQTIFPSEIFQHVMQKYIVLIKLLEKETSYKTSCLAMLYVMYCAM